MSMSSSQLPATCEASRSSVLLKEHSLLELHLHCLTFIWHMGGFTVAGLTDTRKPFWRLYWKPPLSDIPHFSPLLCTGWFRIADHFRLSMTGDLLNCMTGWGGAWQASFSEIQVYIYACCFHCCGCGLEEFDFQDILTQSQQSTNRDRVTRLCEHERRFIFICHLEGGNEG